MQRLGTRETLVRATQEAFAEAHVTATLVARSDVWDELTGAQYSYPGKYKVNADHVHADYAECETALLALSHTQRSAALLALAVAHTLHIPARFAISALSETHAPHRRQELKQLHAGTVAYDGLDDSYNISLTTALSALRRAQGEAERLRKKLVVVVAGIPEAVDGGADNTKLALACLEGAAHTVAIESVFTHHFRAVFARDHDKLTVLPSVRNSVLLELPNKFHPDEWFVLLFNELGDLYH
jgi:UDP-N-acetylmuramyl pentapeptide synthase